MAVKLGSNFLHPKYGPVEVCNMTEAMVCYRLADGTKRRERRPEAMKWQVGTRCWIVPDDEMPDERCRGIVVTLDAKNKPQTVRIDDSHPVWNGALIDAGHCKYWK